MTSGFANGRMHKAYEGHGTLVSFCDHVWELPFEIGIFRLLKRFDVDPVLAVLAIERSYEVALVWKDTLGGTRTISLIESR